MGRDKALVELAGRPLADYPRAALHAAGVAPVLMVGAEVADRVPGRGPLGGIVTALEVCEGGGASHVAFLPVDTPFVESPLIGQLVAAATGFADTGAVAAGSDGRLHPLVSVLPVSWARTLASRVARGSDLSVHAALEGRRVAVIAAADADLANINTPEDLEEAEARAAARAALKPRSTWPARGGR